MRLFRVLFGFDVLALLALLYFFVDGLRYEPGGDYVSTWIPLLLIPGLALAGGWMLRTKGSVTAANVLLGVLALPFAAYLLFVGLIVVLQPDFK